MGLVGFLPPGFVHFSTTYLDMPISRLTTWLMLAAFVLFRVWDKRGPIFPEHLMLINEASKIPYPIIYVHGLVGNATTWEETSSFLTDLGSGFKFSFGRMQMTRAMRIPTLQVLFRAIWFLRINI